jgi:acyl-CoA thioester hydrolase
MTALDPQAGQPRPPVAYPVTVAFPIHWGDMDALGHANNVMYFRWFESARTACFQRIGVSMSGRGVGPILASTSCDFLRPLVYPADVVVGARVARVGETSITIEYGLWRAGAEEELHARGTSVVVLIDYGTGAKVRVPDDVRQAIATLGGPPAGQARSR